MRNAEAWRETKFVEHQTGAWRASRTNVPMTSWLAVDLQVAVYAETLRAHVKGRLIELGCGLVPLYGIYRDQVTDVVCVDWPHSLHQSVHVDIQADLDAPLDLEPGSFDTVVATDVVEHLFKPSALFESAANALKPGGKLILGVPFLYWIHEAPHDYHRYTRFALERLATDAGLVVTAICAYGGAPEILSDIATKAVGSRRMILKMTYGITRALLKLPLIKKLSTATRESFPMGYLLVAQKPKPG